MVTTSLTPCVKKICLLLIQPSYTLQVIRPLMRIWLNVKGQAGSGKSKIYMYSRPPNTPSPNTAAHFKVPNIVSWGNFGHGATSVKKSLRNHFGRINNV